MEMKSRGAERVVGVDHDEDYLAQARFASEVRGLDIEYRRMSVYETASLEEKFDLVLFMGVFYHLRHPLLALDLLHRHVVRDLFVFQSMLRGSAQVHPTLEDYPFSEEEVFNEPGFPRLHFIEKKYTGDPTNWWVPNRACVEAMLRNSGFEILDHPETEVYVCRRMEQKDEFSGLPPGGIDCG